MKIPVIKTGIRKMNFKKMEVYHKDNLIAIINNENDDLKCVYSNNKDLFNPFYFNEGDIINEEIISNFLKSRAFSSSRPDKNELLRNLNLKEYNVLEIVKKTHGIMSSDTIWIKFDDDDFYLNKENREYESLQER